MYPLNDKDLDRLSRDAAEHYDVESSASGWERLETKLDRELPVKEKDRRRFLFWLFFIALLSGGALVYMLVGSPINNNLASQTSETTGREDKTAASAVREADGNTATSTEKTQQAETSAPVAGSNAVPPTTSTNSGVEKTAADKKQSSSEQVTIARKNNTTQPNSSTLSVNKTTTGNKDLSVHKPVRENRTRELNNQPRTNNNVPAAKDKTAKDNNVVSADKTDARADKSVAQNDQQTVDTNVPVTETQKTDVAAAETKTTAKEEPKKEVTEKTEAPTAEKAVAKKADVKKKTAKWEFGLLTGPDFTSVEFTQGHKMGFNIGATVGYRLSNRWLLNTGLIYTTKYYKAAGEYFDPPAHSFISYQDVEEVTGGCSMIEIPLNIRYDFSYSKKGRFFASTGVSSYIMDKQDYECTYYNNAGQLRKYPWKTDSNYNYFLSNVNLSVGYERAIGRNFSVQAEPYLKLPLQGLGYGNMKMNSYGLYVTFKYKPLGRK